VQSTAGKISYHSDSLPEVTPMLTNKSRFPALDEWTRMSEQEQDALLARLEKVRRGRRWLLWAVLCASALGGLWLVVATLP
jgi:hypothetical protein